MSNSQLSSTTTANVRYSGTDKDAAIYNNLDVDKVDELMQGFDRASSKGTGIKHILFRLDKHRDYIEILAEREIAEMERKESNAVMKKVREARMAEEKRIREAREAAEKRAREAREELEKRAREAQE